MRVETGTTDEVTDEQAKLTGEDLEGAINAQNLTEKSRNMRELVYSARKSGRDIKLGDTAKNELIGQIDTDEGGNVANDDLISLFYTQIRKRLLSDDGASGAEITKWAEICDAIIAQNTPETAEPEQSAPTVVEPEATAEVAENTEDPTKNEEYTREEISTQEKDKILENLTLSKDSLNGQTLTVEKLTALGLEPKYKMILDGKEVWVSSNTFLTSDKKISGIIYYQDGNGYRAAPYVQSASQGVFRIYPCYSVQNERVNWFSKGYGEDGLCMDFGAQKLLSDTDPSEDVSDEDADLILVGTAGRFDTGEEATAKGAEMSGVNPKPHLVIDAKYDRIKNFVGNPEDIEITSQELKPNFAEMTSQWERSDRFYGNITYETYTSNDGSLEYLFCRDNQDRAWIAGIQVKDSPKTPAGLNVEWVKGGLLTTPLREYKDQPKAADGTYYGDNTEWVYDYAFDKFLSKIPVIKEYVEHIQTRESGPTKTKVEPPAKTEPVAETEPLTLTVEGEAIEINVGDTWRVERKSGSFNYEIEKVEEIGDNIIAMTFKHVGRTECPRHKWEYFFKVANKIERTNV